MSGDKSWLGGEVSSGSQPAFQFIPEVMDSVEVTVQASGKVEG